MLATLSAPELLAYHVDISVSGTGGTVTGPTPAVYLAGNAGCKAP